MILRAIDKAGRLVLPLALTLMLGVAVSGCDSSGIGPSGPEGGGQGGVDVASIGEQLGFVDGDVLDVEYGIEINFSTPLDPDSLFNTGTQDAVVEGFNVSIVGSDGEEADILRWQLRNGNTTLFIAAELRAQWQYLLRLHPGLGNINGEVLGQMVEGLFLTPPNRFSLFGDNHSSIATAYMGYGYAVPGSLFLGDGSTTYLIDILDSVLEIGDGVDMVLNLINLKRDGAAALILEDNDTGLREMFYADDIGDGFNTKFIGQDPLCRAQDVESLRDLNGDGEFELLLTYNCDDGLGNRAYQNHIYYGRDFEKEVPLVSADFIFSVPQTEIIPPSYGASVGDVNGDDFNDLVRVAYDETLGKGVVHIYMGGPDGILTSTSSKGLLPVPSVEITSVGENDSPLHVKVGDVNGDGIDDIVLVEITALLPVKAPSVDLQSRFVVIPGRESFESQMDTSEPFAVVDCEGQIACGQSRNSFEVADVDGDEIADLLIGSSRYSGVKNVSSSGVVYLIFGGEAIEDDSGNPIDTVSMADRYIFASNVVEFGAKVEYIGDMYNDGGNYFSVNGKNLDVSSLEYFIYDGRELKEMAGKVVGEDYILDSFLPTMTKPK